MTKTFVSILICLLCIPAISQMPNQAERDMSVIYGKGCTNYGVDPDLRIELEQLIIDKDMEQLISWLSSEQLSKQVYAVEGLIRLNNMGYDLSYELIQTIKKVKKKRDKIWTCSGCSFWEESVSSLLKEYKIKE